jgi:N-acetyl-gamma-glutamyl-phosphate reductase
MKDRTTNSLSKIRVGIIGGAGYTGGELIRLLLNHPNADISFIHSRSNAGNVVASVHQDLINQTDLVFTADTHWLQGSHIDVVFLCVGHGEARKFLQEKEVNSSIKVIDLSQDFRLQPKASFKERQYIYGLPELNRENIKKAHSISNPGCFATAIQLSLLPLASKHMLGNVYTTAITGSTGAGQGLSPTAHFSWRANNIQAYKTLSHQHINEIHQSLSQLQPSFSTLQKEGNAGVRFVPWRGDFPRGIFASSTVTCANSLEEVVNLYKEFYADAFFTSVSTESVFLKQVVNTNKCVIHLEQVGRDLVVHAAIDNLIKGASGQAVQNMNLMFGLEETAGLQLKSIAF